MGEPAKEVDIRGKVCPYCIMNIIREVDMMRSGENICFLVDDPLATKSAPEELGEYQDLSMEIEKHEAHWEITVKKS